MRNQAACHILILLLTLAGCATESAPPSSADSNALEEQAAVYAIPGTDETVVVSPAQLGLAEHFGTDPRWVTFEADGAHVVNDDGIAARVDLPSLPPELVTLVSRELRIVEVAQ